MTYANKPSYRPLQWATTLSRRVWQQNLLALLFGIVGTFAFAPFDYWPLALVSLTGLQYVLLAKTAKRAAALGFYWGLGLFGSGINWVYVSIDQFGGLPWLVSVGLVVLLAAYLALYPTLFAWLLSRFWPETNIIRLLFAAPALWQGSEFLRGYLFTGFPWLQFGYSQIDSPLHGIAPILGVEGITFWLMVISGALALFLQQQRYRHLLLAALLFMLPIPLTLLSWSTAQPERTTSVALVQGNIPQSIKWNSDQLAKTLQLYHNMSFPYLGNANIIIWPESAITDIELNQQSYLQQLDRQGRFFGSQIITGIVDGYQQGQTNHFYNTALVVGRSQPYVYHQQNRYQKHHLVPFGEFVPFASLLRPLAPLFNLPMSSFSQGAYYQAPLVANGFRFTTAICYESILGEQLRENFSDNTDFLLVLSNDAWFGHSIGPWQHFQMTRMRSLELARPVLSATNNGVTAVTDNQGKVTGQLAQFTRQILLSKLVAYRGLTPYARLGSNGIWIITLLVFGYSLLRKVRNG